MMKGEDKMTRYKGMFISKVKDTYKGSVENAEKINEAWEVITNYFDDLERELEYEIKLLGNYIEYNHYGDEIEFSIRGNVLAIKKQTFGIEARDLEYLECVDGVVKTYSGHEFSEDMIDDWVYKTVGKFIETEVSYAKHPLQGAFFMEKRITVIG